MSSLLASTLYSLRFGLAIAASALGMVVLSGFAFTTGLLTLPVDANTYAISATSWISFLVAASIMPFVVFQSIAIFQKSTLDLVDEIDRQRAEIEILATHDYLTELPQLNLAQDRLQMALREGHRSGTKVALLFIDLDGFKEVNDRYGHDAGNQVLKEVAKRLLRLLRDVDTAARIGGDEFVLVLGNLKTKENAALVAERLIADISRPMDISEGTVSVGASIGIALSPDNANDHKSLWRAADLAMYAAKEAGKNCFRYSSEGVSNNSVREI